MIEPELIIRHMYGKKGETKILVATNNLKVERTRF